MIACIEDPVVIKKILDHPEKQAVPEQGQLPQSRAPPSVLMVCEAKTTFFKVRHTAAGVRFVKIRGLAKKAGEFDGIWRMTKHCERN